MTARRKWLSAVTVAVLALGGSVAFSTPANAKDWPTCMVAISRTKHSVDVYNRGCNKTFTVKAIFNNGKDVQRSVANNKAYRFSSGSLSSYERSVIVG